MKKRLVGLAVVSSLLLIFLPMLVEEPPPAVPDVGGIVIPDRPEEGFSSRVQPLPPTALTPPPSPAPDLPFLEQAVQDHTPSDMRVRVLGDPTEATQPPARNDPATTHVEPAPLPADGTRVGLQAWIYQVGSFSNPVNAQKLVDELRGMGLPGAMEAVELGGRKLYRVMVGPVMDRAEVEQDVERLGEWMTRHRLRGSIKAYP